MTDSTLPPPGVDPALSAEPIIGFGSPVQQLMLYGGRLYRNYALRAAFQAIITIWAVLTFTFVLVRLLPGSPVDVFIDRQMQTSGMSYDQALARASSIFGTDFQRPLLEQYLAYVNNILHGNMGTSITSTGTPVLDIVKAYLPWTLFSVGLGLLISFIVGLALGMLMAYWRNSLFDTVATTIASFLGSVPSYLLAILIVYFFGVQLKVFSVAAARGAYSPGMTPGFTLDFFLDVLSHATLPIITYLISNFGNWALTMKNSTLGVLGEEYVTAAQARGLGQWRILTAYVGRNAALPLFTQLALSIGFVIGGSTIIEQYFLYPGVGYKLITAIRDRDYTVMQGIFLVITVAVIVANLMTDFLYSRLDPRVRLSKG